MTLPVANVEEFLSLVNEARVKAEVTAEVRIERARLMLEIRSYQARPLETLKAASLVEHQEKLRSRGYPAGQWEEPR